jgi:hypothetical protein
MEPRAGGAPSQRISPITKGELVFQRSTDVESDLMIRFGDDQVVPTILQDGGFASERQGLRRLYRRKLVKEPVVVRLNQGNPGSCRLSFARMVKELDLFESNHSCGLSVVSQGNHPKRT